MPDTTARNDMSALLTLSACAVATWLLRVAFITLLPADRLPEAAHRALRYAGPAVLGAMVVTSLIGPDHRRAGRHAGRGSGDMNRCGLCRTAD